MTAGPAAPPRASFDDRAEQRAGDAADRAARASANRADAARVKAGNAGARHGKAQHRAGAKPEALSDDDAQALAANSGADPAELQTIYNDEATRADTEAATQAPATASHGSPGLFSGGSSTGLVQNGAGAILGLIAFALARAFLKGGTAEARGWIAAKFLNRPYTGAAPPPPAAAGKAATPTAPSVLHSTPALPTPGVTAVPRQPNLPNLPAAPG